MKLILKEGEEITIILPGMDEIEEKMELVLEEPDLNPQDMINIVLEDLAEAGVLIRGE